LWIDCSEMACGLALKRPHDFDSYLSEGAGGLSDAKRARPTHCSPFRPQLGTIAASLPSCSKPKLSLTDPSSPFAEASKRCQITAPQIESYLKAEIRSLRRRKLLPRRLEAAVAGLGGGEGTEDAENAPNAPNASKANYRPPNSPQSGSDSEGECSSSSSRRVPTSAPMMMTKLNEQPMFSLKHVQMIVQRLLNEQEMRLRNEYEGVLSKKLDEQHAQFCQFADEQMATRAAKTDSDDFSYLS
ncbi:hypothetical protein PFISCL1PPCAC_19484, partial [Pristionchus fissidentatus]